PGRGERHEGPGGRGEVGHRVDGPGAVPVDAANRSPVAVDGVPWAEIAVRDDLPRLRRPRVETVAGDGGRNPAAAECSWRISFAAPRRASSVLEYGGSRCPWPGCQPESMATSPPMKVSTSRLPSVPARGASPRIRLPPDGAGTRARRATTAPSAAAAGHRGAR